METPARPDRDLSRWKRKVIEVPRIGKRLRVRRRSIVTVPVGDHHLDASIDPAPGGSDTAFVSFSAAMHLEKWTTPYFVGATLPGDLNVHKVMLADPGLDTPGSPRLAWYAGTDDIPKEQLYDFARWVVDSTKARRIVLFGASGGGFAALNYARLFENATVIAVNPQTNILRYRPDAWQAYARAAFGATTPAAAEDAIRTNTDFNLCETYAARDDVSVVYVQNETDESHVSEHMRPFLEAVPKTADVDVLLGNWGEGHIAPPKDELDRIVQNVILGESPHADRTS